MGHRTKVKSNAEDLVGVAANRATATASRFPPAPHFLIQKANVDPAAAKPASENIPANSALGYYPWLDVLRGISWIMVVVGHSNLRYQYVASMGVAIFFAISGWLITKIIVAHRETNAPLASFYARRCLRILPLYLVFIAVTCTTCYFFPGWKDFFPFLPSFCGPHKILPYLLTFSAEYWRGGGAMLVGHCWSLCVEERFYVFWPLILAYWPNRILSHRALIVFAVTAWYLALQPLSYENFTVALSFLPFPLLLGCGLAIFFPKARAAVPSWLTIPLGSLLMGLYFSYAQNKVIYAGFTVAAYSLHAAFLATGLVACAVLSRSGPRDPVSRLLQWLGKLSYAAYLIHPIFAYIAINIAMKAGYYDMAPLIAVPLCVPFAYALHRWFELPILATRRTVEQSARLRNLCAGLQVAPILLGLVFLFPWLGLWHKTLSLPAMLFYLVVSVVLAWLAGVLQDGLAAMWHDRRIRGRTRFYSPVVGGQVACAAAEEAGH